MQRQPAGQNLARHASYAITITPPATTSNQPKHAQTAPASPP